MVHRRDHRRHMALARTPALVAVVVSTPAVAVLAYGLGVITWPVLAVATGIAAASIHEWNLARSR